ncbi:xenotropic and polytropic retrovirus receptor 1-like [Paramacrobiotus metropolitanus]|uniref:xenotropic and polytropic retrovirus receptor 1-like n=1 Tax=Paramacrobiotus metropolitanus TaxID=2943436 RepID=UPI002445FEFA|nr:xenotropic and polytropic retrovirus receptor 1-like [Paramacrobiotus metropolitanus]
MKFGAQLASQLTPEWRTQYLNYDDMKEMLAQVIEHAPRSFSPTNMMEQPHMDRASRLLVYFAEFEDKFFVYCDKELTKINTFFNEKLAEAQRKLAALKMELRAHFNLSQLGVAEDKGARLSHKMTWFAELMDKDARNAKRMYRKVHDLKLAFSEYYLSLILLQNFQNLNTTGFRKILKKHDKVLDTDKGMTWRIQHVEVSSIYQSKEVDRLIMETETVVTKDLEAGNRSKAMQRLRVPPLNEQAAPSVFFLMGLLLGSFSILLIDLVAVAAVSGLPFDIYTTFNATTNQTTINHDRVDWRIVVRLYRGPFLFIVQLFLFAGNVHGWRSAGVNHVLIFELDPRNHLTQHHIVQLAALFAVLWISTVLAFFHSDAVGVPHYVVPIILPSIMLILLLNPFQMLFSSARRWFLRTLWKIITAPYHTVAFSDFWVADQITSTVQALQDVQYLLCFYAFEVPWVNNGVPSKTSICTSTSHGIRPVLAAIPAWFRFAQCIRRYRDSNLAFPHLVNMTKYSLTFFIVLFATLNALHGEKFPSDPIMHRPVFYCWMVLTVLGSCYSFVWDMRMDWGFLDSSSKEHPYLRDSLVYASIPVYHGCLVLNFFLRFARTFSISTDVFPFALQEVLTTVLAILELNRRCIWNFFRLENEHLNNCGAFRAVRDLGAVAVPRPRPAAPASDTERIRPEQPAAGEQPGREPKPADSKAELFPINFDSPAFAGRDSEDRESGDSSARSRRKSFKAELFPLRGVTVYEIDEPATTSAPKRRSLTAAELFPVNWKPSKAIPESVSGELGLKSHTSQLISDTMLAMPETIEESPDEEYAYAAALNTRTTATNIDHIKTFL